MRMRRVHLTMRTEGTRAFSNRYGVVVWTGENDTKTISVDANLFENGAKQRSQLDSSVPLQILPVDIMLTFLFVRVKKNPREFACFV